MSITPGLIPDLDNDTYHAQAEWLSSTQLKGALPEHYKPFTGSTDALDFGNLFHTVVLEPAQVSRYTPLDADKIGVKSDGSKAMEPTKTAAWKKAVAEAEQDGGIVVAQADMDKALAMAEAVHAHDTAAALLFGEDGTYEESAFAVDGAGLQHKARFDRRIPGAIVDLKSTSAQPGCYSLGKAVIDYGYDLSAAHYLEVAALLDLDVQAFALVFVGKTAPYRVTVAELDEAFLVRGRALRARAIERHHNPAAPRYEGASGFLTIPAPRWAQIEELTA